MLRILYLFFEILLGSEQLQIPMDKTRWTKWKKKHLCLLSFFYWAYALLV